MSPLTLALAAALALAVQPQAHAAPIHIRDAWSRPTATPLGVGYLTIVNRGHDPDRLVAVSSPEADSVTLHRSAVRNGIASMQAVAGGLEIPAQGAVSLQPGGYHLMLSGLKHPLRAGERVPLVLDFRRSGRVRAELAVRTGPPARMHMR